MISQIACINMNEEMNKKTAAIIEACFERITAANVPDKKIYKTLNAYRGLWKKDKLSTNKLITVLEYFGYEVEVKTKLSIKEK